MNETKICTKCKRELPLSQFWEDIAYKDGHKTWCREMHREHRLRQKEYSRCSYEEYLAEKEALRKAEEILGGWKMYYLKHPKKGESMYNAIATTGDVFKTNDKKEFLRFVAEL